MCPMTPGDLMEQAVVPALAHPASVGLPPSVLAAYLALAVRLLAGALPPSGGAEAGTAQRVAVDASAAGAAAAAAMAVPPLLRQRLLQQLISCTVVVTSRGPVALCRGEVAPPPPASAAARGDGSSAPCPSVQGGTSAPLPVMEYAAWQVGWLGAGCGVVGG